MGSHILLQGIFLTQESNQGLPHCRQTLHKLSRQGRPSAQSQEANRLIDPSELGTFLVCFITKLSWTSILPTPVVSKLPPPFALLPS